MDPITETFTVTVDGAVTAQVLRFDVESSSGGITGASAIEVFGTSDATR
jgi:hypothetical protein